MSAQAPTYGFTITQARTPLLRLKQVRTLPFVFIPDEHDVSLLPSWVRAPTQITDGHLSKLATANGAVLGTLHENIPRIASDSVIRLIAVAGLW